MLQRWWVVLSLVAGFVMGAALVWAQMTRSESVIWAFENGVLVPHIRALDGSSTATLTSAGLRLTPPAVQTIAAGGTIAADACGGVKPISAAGAVTTSTTNTFTAPASANAGCWMLVCNVGPTNAITLDNNALFKSLGAADIIMSGEDCTQVVSDGTVWRSAGSLLAN